MTSTLTRRRVRTAPDIEVTARRAVTTGNGYRLIPTPDPRRTGRFLIPVDVVTSRRVLPAEGFIRTGFDLHVESARLSVANPATLTARLGDQSWARFWCGEVDEDTTTIGLLVVPQHDEVTITQPYANPITLTAGQWVLHRKVIGSTQSGIGTDQVDIIEADLDEHHPLNR